MITPHFNRVMLIDDSRVDRYIIKNILAGIHFADVIVEKESAQEALMALEKFSHQPALIPDIIFLDLRMPVLDGFDFLELYECMPDIIKLKSRIYLLTGSEDLKDKKRAGVNKFVNGYFQKPLLNIQALKELMTLNDLTVLKIK